MSAEAACVAARALCVESEQTFERRKVEYHADLLVKSACRTMLDCVVADVIAANAAWEIGLGRVAAAKVTKRDADAEFDAAVADEVSLCRLQAREPGCKHA